MACAACDTLAAMPFFAGTAVEHLCIRVGMRCRECGNEWRLDMASADDTEREPTQDADYVYRPETARSEYRW